MPFSRTSAKHRWRIEIQLPTASCLQIGPQCKSWVSSAYTGGDDVQKRRCRLEKCTTRTAVRGPRTLPCGTPDKCRTIFGRLCDRKYFGNYRQWLRRIALNLPLYKHIFWGWSQGDNRSRCLRCSSRNTTVKSRPRCVPWGLPRSSSHHNHAILVFLHILVP